MSIVSGMLFTQELNTGAPYYVINYDDVSGRTDTVTSGSQEGNQTLFVNRESVNRLSSPRFRLLLIAVKEIEQITNHNVLDIEFAIDSFRMWLRTTKSEVGVSPGPPQKQ